MEDASEPLLPSIIRIVVSSQATFNFAIEEGISSFDMTATDVAVYCLRLVAMITPFVGHQTSLVGGPVFGVHYNQRNGEQAVILPPP